MRTPLRAGLLAMVCLPPSPVLAGDTDPPPGPIAGTMKTLDEVEARTPINVNTASPPLLISAPGNYYLTGNVVVPQGEHGIVVDLASDPGDAPVIIDLNGFSILGSPGSLDGVRFTAEFENGRYVLRSGVPGSTIAGVGGNGVFYMGDPPLVDGAAPVIVSGIHISNCGSDGVHVSNARVCGLDVSVSGCGGDGVEVTQCGTIKRELEIDLERRGGGFRIAGCGGTGFTATDCDSVTLAGLSVAGVGSHGVLLQDVRDGKIDGIDASGCAGDGVRVIGSGGDNVLAVQNGRVSGCTGHGISAESLDEAIVSACRVSDGGGDGVHLDSCNRSIVDKEYVDNQIGKGISVTTPTSPGIYRVEVTECESVVNDLQGVVVLCNAGVTTVDIADTTATGNGAGGIEASWLPGEPSYGNITLRRCEASANTGDGFGVAPSSAAGVDDRGNTIVWESCTATNNTGNGFSTEAGDETYTRCTAVTNAGDGFFSDPIVNKAILKAYFATGSDSNGGNGYTVVNHAASFREAHARGNAGHGAALSISPGPFNPCEWQVIGSDFSNNDGHGLSVVRGDLLVRDSVFDGNGHGGVGIPYDGISCENLDNADVHHSHCRNNSGAGARVNELESRLQAIGFLGCTAGGNGGGGFVVEGAAGVVAGHVRVRDCDASGNGGHGVAMLSSAAGEVRGCTLSGNGGVGLSVTNTGHVVVQNTLAGNALGAISAPPTGSSIGPLIDEIDASSAACLNPLGNIVR